MSAGAWIVFGGVLALIWLPTLWFIAVEVHHAYTHRRQMKRLAKGRELDLSQPYGRARLGQTRRKPQ